MLHYKHVFPSKVKRYHDLWPEDRCLCVEGGGGVVVTEAHPWVLVTGKKGIYF